MSEILLGDPISIENGFTVQITNFDSYVSLPGKSYRDYHIRVEANSEPLTPPGFYVFPSENGMITVKNLIAGQKVKLLVYFRNLGLAPRIQAISKEGTPALKTILVPELTNLVSTEDGFTATIANWNKDYKFTASPNTEIKKDRVVRKGLKRGQRGPVTITTSRSGYESGTATVTHFADPLKATYDAPKSIDEEGWTAQLTNYTTNTDYIWTFVAVNGIGELGASDNAPAVSPGGLLTVRGLSGAGTTSSVQVTISRGNGPSWEVVDGVNEYESGEATIIGTSMQPSERWIHVGLLGPDTEHKLDNNNDTRPTYILKSTSAALVKPVTVYEISYISHLTPAQMKDLVTGNDLTACDAKKSFLLEGDEELKVNETTENVNNTLFTYYWSQQDNLKIIEGADNNSIKINGKYTQTSLQPREILDLLTTDDQSIGLLHKISYWGNTKNTNVEKDDTEDADAASKRPYGMVLSAELPLTFVPSLWKLPVNMRRTSGTRIVSSPYEFNLVQTLKSGWFNGNLKASPGSGIRRIVRPAALAYRYYNDSRSLFNGDKNPDTSVRKFSYPLGITVCVILEYQIEGEVREYKDFITAKTLPERLKTTKYTLNKRVPIKMMLPYQMVREFTGYVENSERFRNALDGTDSRIYLEPLGLGHPFYRAPGHKDETKAMEDFQAHLLKEIPEIIQRDIDSFLVDGPGFWTLFDKEVDSDGVQKIDFNQQIPYQKKTSSVDTKYTRRPRVQSISEDRCYYYKTYNIHLGSLKAATSDIFISRLTIVDGSRNTYAMTITFYNDLDRNPDVASVPPITDLGLEVSHVDTDLLYQTNKKSLMPQFMDDTRADSPARYHLPSAGVRTLVGGVADLDVNAGWVDVRAGWVQTELFEKPAY